MFDRLVNIPFLNEPAWRWFVAFGAMLLFAASWRTILRHMQGFV
jgi:hypothetical protein